MPLFIRRPQQAQIVEAEQVGAGSQAHPQGSRPARPGDWLVTDHSTAQQTVLTPEEFSAQYEAMSIPQHLDPTQSRINQGDRGTPGDQGPQEGPESNQWDDQTSGSEFPNREPVDANQQPLPGLDQPQPPDRTRESGDRSPLSQQIREQLPGRAPTTGEFRPRDESSAPVESPTGLPDQPGDADKAFHERDETPDDNPNDANGPEEMMGPPAPTTPAHPTRSGQPPV